MLITLWSSLGDNAGMRVDVAWKDLGAVIAALPEGALFSCATFNGERGKDTFAQATAVVLDHDLGTVPFAAVCEALKRSRALVYETRTAGRWRAILPLPQPVIGYDRYTQAVLPLAESFQCARESATGSQMWFPPRKGYRYLSPLDGESRLMAWITGDWTNPLVSRDMPVRDHDASQVDRSALDMRIMIRLAEIGLDRAECDAIFAARNGLSHSISSYHLDLLWNKANAWREAHGASDEMPLWGNGSRHPEAPVIVWGPDIHRVADESVSAIAGDDRIFTRDAAIVELITRNASTPITRGLSAASIQDRLSRAAKMVQINKEGEQRPLAPPRELAEIIRDRGTYPALRHLRGITEVPILRLDGSIAEAPGFDSETGFFRSPGLVIKTKARKPEDALKTLREPFAEFPWANRGMVDIPVALVCAITCRAAVGGNVPLFVFDASKAGSGKSLVTETVSAITQGGPSGAGRFPGDDDELAKNLAAQARKSAPLTAFDNVTRPVQGEALDSALTCNGRVSFRILGQSKIATCDWYSVIAVNGNQIRVGGDTRRRAIVARITPHARKSDYRHTLPRYGLENRADLLSAAIALVQNGILTGTAKLDHRPSFEAFLKSIAGAIVAAGGNDITQFWREEDAVTDSDDARDTIVSWLAIRWPDGATASQIADDLGDSFMASAQAQALLNQYGLEARMKEAMRHISEVYPKATKRQAVAYALHSWRDVPSVGGARITGESGRNAVWRVSL